MNRNIRLFNELTLTSRSKLMMGVGVDDFTLKDIIKPETPRLRMIFSGVINFAKFREEQLVLFEEFSSKSVKHLASSVFIEPAFLLG
jgi:kinetochore protein Nuf2